MTEDERRYLTFEAGGHLFAVDAETVATVTPAGRPLPEGTNVIDIVGLIAPTRQLTGRGCFVVLRGAPPASPPMALTASRAREVLTLDPSRLLPLPSFLFGGPNPFQGLLTGQGSAGSQAIFLFGNLGAILAAAEAA